MKIEANKNIKQSATIIGHFIRLILRVILFFSALLCYISKKENGNSDIILRSNHPILWIIGILFSAEIISRFFPSKYESMGCQKQFANNYRHKKTGPSFESSNASSKTTIAVAVVWLVPNIIIGLLYLCDIVDEDIMLLLCLAYSVCDIVCILFFCPFQEWIMKNKCCVTCRIYNWDYAMIFTPFLFVKSAYTWWLSFASVVLLIKWEITGYRHPERFFEKSNCALSCAECHEKLCRHKKQIKRLKNV